MRENLSLAVHEARVGVKQSNSVWIKEDRDTSHVCFRVFVTARGNPRQPSWSLSNPASQNGILWNKKLRRAQLQVSFNLSIVQRQTVTSSSEGWKDTGLWWIPNKGSHRDTAIF